ncbi:MAG: alpha/beta fold hydrolase [Halobacteriovoraceae bacterium]|nr:alpha/beta fold hydrolase [Halobacteriovoraceae bacterium]MCB9095577.1 alpha/beta fold hydrolase [Halobacteriovoraceae bacterium]
MLTNVQEIYLDLFSDHKVFCRIREASHSEWLIVTHGIGEHCGRYNFIFDELAHKYNILLYDLRGHGKSSGKRGYIDQFSRFKKDLNQLLHYLKSKYNAKKFSLLGHSMGALITADFMQSYRTLDGNVLSHDFYPEKIFLSSPPAGNGGALGEIVNKVPSKVFNILANINYGLSLGNLFDLGNLSHDVNCVEAYKNDPLVMKKLHTRLIFQLIDTARKVFQKPLNVTCPLYCIVGTDDEIVSPKAIENYAQHIDPHMNLKIVQEGRHELHNEIERIRVYYIEYLKECFL